MNNPFIQNRGAMAVWLLFTLLSANAAFASKKPLRIVSMNLCTDQFLLAVGHKDQIVALSPYAYDKNSSHYADRAKGLPRIREGSESVIRLKPDILLATSFDKKTTLQIVRNQGIKVVVLQYPSSLKQIADQILEVGRVTGREEEAKQLYDEFMQTVNKSRGIFLDKKQSALYYQRGGYASGRYTLIGILLDHVGLTNHAYVQGISFYGALPLEKIVADPPDIFMIARYNRSETDPGRQILQHPALQKVQQNKSVIEFPVSETVCPGPSTINALQRLIKLKEQH